MRKGKIYWIFILLASIKLTKVNGQDWANLSKFKNANIELNALKTKNRIVFMGNSITEYWPKVSPSFFENNNFINRILITYQTHIPTMMMMVKMVMMMEKMMKMMMVMMMIMAPFWHHCGISGEVLELFLGSFWNHVGIALGQLT